MIMTSHSHSSVVPRLSPDDLIIRNYDNEIVFSAMQKVQKEIRLSAGTVEGASIRIGGQVIGPLTMRPG
jgi:hypothetical protein